MSEKFKRRQSKVFWSQMKSRDLRDSSCATVTPEFKPREARPLPLPTSREHEQAFTLPPYEPDNQEEIELKSAAAAAALDFSNSGSIPESDSIDSKSRTVIQILSSSCLPNDPSSNVTVALEDSEPPLNLANLDLLEERYSFSPTISRGQRSQDSGFSDSERSIADSSDPSPESPLRRCRRRHRRSGSKSNRQRNRRQAELHSTRPQEEQQQHQLNGPAHTSTPKQQEAGQNQQASTAARQALKHSSQLHDFGLDDMAKEPAEKEGPGPTVGEEASGCCCSPETLEDFLYASDLPPPPPTTTEEHESETQPASQSTSARRITSGHLQRISWRTRRASSSISGKSRLTGSLLAVRSWLEDLRCSGGEDECQATLQNKSLPPRHRAQPRVLSEGAATAEDDNITFARELGLVAAAAVRNARKLIDVAERFDAHYQQALESIGDWKTPRVAYRKAVARLKSEAAEILTKLACSTLPFPQLRINSSSSSRTCRREEEKTLPSLAIQLARLKQTVDRALDSQLDFHIEKVVRGLLVQESGKAAAATITVGQRGALAGLTALGLAGPRAGASVARCAGIGALLRCLRSTATVPCCSTGDSPCSDFSSAPPNTAVRRNDVDNEDGSPVAAELRSASLRALASVCCCLEALDQFVSEAGPEILAGLLTAETTPEAERSEAAALLVQISSPWMDYLGLPYLEPYGPELVRALTDLAERTSCKQTLLLAAAGINNLARSSSNIAPIITCASIKKLLRCIKNSRDGNVWLMEQVASLIGQVARLPQARAHLAEIRASVALVCFLRLRPPGLGDEYYRLVTTASEALARLCVEPEIAKQVVVVGGSDCLSESCIRPTMKPLPPQHHSMTYYSSNSSGSHSLRLARKLAAEQIGIARIHDCSLH